MARRPPSSSYDVLLYFIAIFVPPIPVFLKRGCSADVLINILLWILGWIPGVLHAWWIITKYERPEMSARGPVAPVGAAPVGNTAPIGTTTAMDAPAVAPRNVGTGPAAI